MAASAQPTEPPLRGSVNKQQKVYIILEITIFCSKSQLFPCEWQRNAETKQPVKFQLLFKVTNEIYRKMKDKESPRVNFAAFVPKSLIYLFIENENRCN